jgi:hypothetical protein
VNYPLTLHRNREDDDDDHGDVCFFFYRCDGGLLFFLLMQLNQLSLLFSPSVPSSSSSHFIRHQQ